jgi:hypothetical protein
MTFADGGLGHRIDTSKKSRGGRQMLVHEHPDCQFYPSAISYMGIPTRASDASWRYLAKYG